MIERTLLSNIGVLAKPHGIKGEISARIDAGVEPDDVPGFGHIFVETDGLMVPFSILATRPKGSESMILALKGIDSQEDAAALTGKDIWIETRLLPDSDDSNQDGFYIDDLVGFTIESDGTTVGTIEGFDDSTENVLFTVVTNGGDELLIPASEQLIESIDPDRRTVVMNLPEGLLTL